MAYMDCTFVFHVSTYDNQMLQLHSGYNYIQSSKESTAQQKAEIESPFFPPHVQGCTDMYDYPC